MLKEIDFFASQHFSQVSDWTGSTYQDKRYLGETCILFFYEGKNPQELDFLDVTLTAN